MTTLAGAQSGQILSQATLTGLIEISAASEETAQVVFALPPVTYDGESPVEVRAQLPLLWVAKNIEGRLLLRRADTRVVLGTLARVIGQAQDRVDTITLGAVLTLAAGTYGLEIAGWSGLGGFAVEGGLGGAHEALVPGYALVMSVLTVPPLPPPIPPGALLRRDAALAALSTIAGLHPPDVAAKWAWLFADAFVDLEPGGGVLRRMTAEEWGRAAR
jgi:hypothetical protein